MFWSSDFELPDSIKQNSLHEANSRSSSREVTFLYGNQIFKTACKRHVPVPSRMDRVHIHLIQFNFNINHQSVRHSPNFLLVIRIFTETV